MQVKNEDYLKVCGKGDINEVKALFSTLNRQDIESIRDSHKASCLHYAARNGCINVLEYLILNKNVSPFLVSEVGATMMHDAAVKGRVGVIDWTLKNTNLSTTFKDANGATILHLACKFDQLALVNWILVNDGAKCAKMQTFNGGTCLHFAAATNSLTSVRKILEVAPSLINIQMMNGVTAIYLAVQENNITMVKYLAKNGGNVNIKAEDGMNGIHVACQNGNLDMVQFLYEEFAVNLNEKDYSGATPLHYACINGNSNLVAFLLSNGSKIVVDKFGNSPLHDCSVGGYLECARLLIANNCDVLLKDNQNMTSADIAESYGHVGYAREIRKFEAMSESKSHTIERYDCAPTKPEPKSDSKKSTLNKSAKKSTETNSVVRYMKDSSLEEEENNEKAQQSKSDSVTSPIFSSLAVVNTSTPSSLEEQPIDRPVEKNRDSDAKFVTKSTTSSAQKQKQDFSVQVNRNEIKAEMENTQPKPRNNQGFIKIIREEETAEKEKKNPLNGTTKSNESKVAIDELDKCIAEFEIEDPKVKNKKAPSNEQASIKLNITKITSEPKLSALASPDSITNVSSTSASFLTSSAQSNTKHNGLKKNLNNSMNDNSQRMSNTIDTIEFMENDSALKSPERNDNNNNNIGLKNNFMKSFSSRTSNQQISTLPSKLTQSSSSSAIQIAPAPPPPPPPMPNAWLSLNENSNTSKNFLRTSNFQNKEATNNQNKSKRSSGNFIDELQTQFKNGGLSSVLRKKNTPVNQNQNINNIFNNVRGSSSANDIKKILKSNDENQNANSSIKPNIEHDIKQLRESLLKKHEPQIPEWKRQLIEKRKQRQNGSIKHF